MSELIRSVRVYVEIDTNKGTYIYDQQPDSLDGIGQQVDEWIEERLP